MNYSYAPPSPDSSCPPSSHKRITEQIQQAAAISWSVIRSLKHVLCEKRPSINAAVRHLRIRRERYVDSVQSTSGSSSRMSIVNLLLLDPSFPKIINVPLDPRTPMLMKVRLKIVEILNCVLHDLDHPLAINADSGPTRSHRGSHKLLYSQAHHPTHHQNQKTDTKLVRPNR